MLADRAQVSHLDGYEWQGSGVALRRATRYSPLIEARPALVAPAPCWCAILLLVGPLLLACDARDADDGGSAQTVVGAELL